MDDSLIELCPCESGLAHGDCCGLAGRTALNADVMLHLSNEGVASNGTATAQIQSALENLSTRPDLFPARINFFENKAYFLKISPRWYQESVFLDPGRIKGSYVIESNLQYLQQICESTQWRKSA